MQSHPEPLKHRKTETMKTARLTYTKLDGTRNSVEFWSIAELLEKFAASKAKYPSHDFQEQIEVAERKHTGTSVRFEVCGWNSDSRQWEPLEDGSFPPATCKADAEADLEEARRRFLGKLKVIKSESPEFEVSWVAFVPA